jgi:hypothetical protein
LAPLERISGTLTNALYGAGWLPSPGTFQLRPGGHPAGRARGDQGDLAPQQHLGPAVHDRDRRNIDFGSGSFTSESR